MKSFNFVLFSERLREVRGKTSQDIFARELGVNRSTLSLLENGKQYPTVEQLNYICEKVQVNTDYFFMEAETEDKLVLLMGMLDEEDKDEFERVLERHKVKMTYRALQKL